MSPVSLLGLVPVVAGRAFASRSSAYESEVLLHRLASDGFLKWSEELDLNQSYLISMSEPVHVPGQPHKGLFFAIYSLYTVFWPCQMILMLRSDFTAQDIIAIAGTQP